MACIIHIIRNQCSKWSTDNDKHFKMTRSTRSSFKLLIYCFKFDMYIFKTINRVTFCCPTLLFAHRNSLILTNENTMNQEKNEVTDEERKGLLTFNAIFFGNHFLFASLFANEWKLMNNVCCTVYRNKWGPEKEFEIDCNVIKRYSAQ